jgi:hypothetical protein
MGTTNNDTWIIEAGDADIAKRIALEDFVLSPLERLIYCVRVADYGCAMQVISKRLVNSTRTSSEKQLISPENSVSDSRTTPSRRRP